MEISWIFIRCCFKEDYAFTPDKIIASSEKEKWYFIIIAKIITYYFVNWNNRIRTRLLFIEKV